MIWSPSLGSQEGELIEQFIKQESQGSGINESCYILKTTPPRCPLLTSLNDIIIADSTDGPQQTNPNDNITPSRTVHSNIAPVGHSIKLSGHTMAKGPPQTMTSRI